MPTDAQPSSNAEAAPPSGRSPVGRALRWCTGATAVGLAASVFVHVFGSIILGSVIVGQRGTIDGIADQSLSIAPAIEPAPEVLETVEPATSEPDGVPQSVIAALETPPMLDDIPLESEATLDNSIALPAISTTGFSDSSLAPGRSGTSFFGLEARGSRFAYVVDTSGSMIDDRIERLRDELLVSIQNLDSLADFFVIRYSTDASSLGGQNTWIDATDVNKKWAERAMQELEAEGVTRPVEGFQLLRRLDLKPDAIFFMTDAQSFPAGSVEEILRIQRRLGAPIHCITFGTDAGADIMRQIADASDGQYRHVQAGP